MPNLNFAICKSLIIFSFFTTVACTKEKKSDISQIKVKSATEEFKKQEKEEEKKEPAAISLESSESVQNGTNSLQAGETLPLKLKVANAEGNILSGVEVSWNIESGNGSLENATSTTDTEGYAKNNWVLGTQVGVNEVVAKVTGTEIKASYTATTKPAPAASISEVQNDSESAIFQSGATKPMVLVVKDSFGNPVSGMKVSWTVISGGGVLAANEQITDEKGQVSNELTLGSLVGENIVNASLEDGTIAATFSTVTIPGPVDSVSVKANNLQTAIAGNPLALPFVAIVMDANGNPVAGVPVSWSIQSGSGSLALASSAVSAADGTISSGILTLGVTAGTNTVTAMIDSGTTKIVTFEATGTAGAPDSIAIHNNNSQTAVVSNSLALPFVAIVKDANGNPVSDVSVSWSIQSGGGSLAPTSSSVTATDGTISSGLLTLGSVAGSNVINASIETGTIKVATFSATGTPDSADQIEVSAANNQTGNAGTVLSLPFTAVVKDTHGNPVSNVTITWAVETGGGSLSSTSVITSTDGTGSSTLTLGNLAGTNTVSATIESGSSKVATFSATGEVGPPAKLAFKVEPSSATAGATLTPAVEVKITDNAGNIVSTATDNITLAIETNPNLGTLNGTLTKAASSGIATFSDLSVDKLGTGFTLVATASGLTQASSFAFTIKGNISISGPAAPLSSSCALYTVSLTDNSGNFLSSPGNTLINVDENSYLVSTSDTSYCSSSLGTQITSLAIESGKTSGKFYLRPTSEDNTQLQFSSDSSWMNSSIFQSSAISANLSPGTAGAADTTFNGTGIVVTNRTQYEEAYAVKVQPDGKTVFGGYTCSNADPEPCGFYLIRYNANGSIDTDFATNGSVTTYFSSYAQVNAVDIQMDGKIIAVGRTGDTIVLVRYDSNGSLDSSFGSGGRVTTSISGNDRGNTIKVLSDGKFLVGGHSYNGSNYWDFLLLRYQSDGSLDSTFGTGGVATAAINSGNDYSYTLTLQADEKIILGGETYNGSEFVFGLVRFNSNGSLDTSFGTGGKVSTTVGGGSDYSYIKGVVVQPDGKIVAGGDSSSKVAFARYNSDGTIDTDFGSGGTSIDSSTNVSFVAEMAMQPNGKFVVATTYSWPYSFDIFRYNNNGSIDTSFASSGKYANGSIGGGDRYTYAMDIGADGKIIVVGGDYYDYLLVRLWP